MEDQRPAIYEKFYQSASRVLTWIEFAPLPFTITCSIIWIITSIHLLCKRDYNGTPSQHRKSLRLHYVTALHRQRIVQYALLLIAVSSICTDLTLTAITAYKAQSLLKPTNNSNNNSNTTRCHIETGQWGHLDGYKWLYISWLVPMTIFAQAYYWSIALIPITTKSYFNTKPSQKHFIFVAVYILIRDIFMAILWINPFTIPLGIITSIITTVLDWVLIMYYFYTGYRVAKNSIEAILKGADDREGIDSNFIPKLRTLFTAFCIVFSIIMVSVLQAFLIGFVLPMIVYPNCWLKLLYSSSVDDSWTFGKDHVTAFTIIQMISMLEIRVVICIWRVVFIALSVFAFILIIKFKMKQKEGRKLKRKAVKETTRLL
ncbi:hypothetical protein LOD99_11634 [Oopsacas minuta]|uniref:Uncharacterized protein n=1 Tax=Oopsacas minuta TaxID=111878 RepID=A0AAV7JKM1_9METZ|nr:hypothetical protein LOD99_11634 [Oopsacas minuta]